MRILLAGHAGFFNKGCEAIVRATVMMLRKEFRSPTVALASDDPVNDRAMWVVPGMKILPSRLWNVWKRGSPSWALRQLCKLYSREQSLKVRYLPLLLPMMTADAVLAVGGDNYTLDYGFPGYHLTLNRVVKSLGKPMVVWGASVGPFAEDTTLKDVVAGLKAADLITARESLTVDYLGRLGVVDNVRKVADPAFLLPPEEMLMDGILPEGKEVVGFNLSPILGKYRGGKSSAAIIAESVAFLKRLLGESDYYILLIPHVTRSNHRNNDALFMEAISRALKHTGRVGMAPALFNCQQIKYIISLCRFFIGARTHAAIAALSSGVPTISIGYSVKSRGINRDVLGSEDYVLPARELTGRALFGRFVALAAREGELRQTLARRIPEVQQLAWKNVEYLRELLGKKNPSRI